MKPNLARTILALSCLTICTSGGCEHSQTHNGDSQLSKQIDALATRLEDLEGRPQQDSTSPDAAKAHVDSDESEVTFADATHVVTAGHNVLIYFATTNYAPGAPSESTAQLCVYINYYTAKRLQAALTMSVQRHAAVFGEAQPSKAAGQPTTQGKTAVIYANTAQLTGNPEELIIELGINPKPVGIPTKPILTPHTTIMDFHTATTFLHQVSTLVEEYEVQNGPIETNIKTRIRN